MSVVPLLSNHDLVVGGSGMLAGLCEALSKEGRTISVLARGRARLGSVAARARNMHPISADYTVDDDFDRALRTAILEHGPIERCVCWIHSIAPRAPLIVAQHVTKVFCHVLGSSAADPSRPELLSNWRDRLSSFGLDYRAAVLGFIRDAGRSRWLTDEEICAGVKRALDGRAPITIVGTVVPWEDRP